MIVTNIYDGDDGDDGDDGGDDGDDGGDDGTMFPTMAVQPRPLWTKANSCNEFLSLHVYIVCACGWLGKFFRKGHIIMMKRTMMMNMVELTAMVEMVIKGEGEGEVEVSKTLAEKFELHLPAQGGSDGG